MKCERCLLVKDPEAWTGRNGEYLKKFEKTIIFTLIGMICFVILIETIELGWIIVADLISPPYFPL